MPDYVNSFKSQVFTEETILGADGKILGTIRIKPSGILWKPRGASQYYRVSLDKFTEWIMSDEAGATRTGS